MEPAPRDPQDANEQVSPLGVQSRDAAAADREAAAIDRDGAASDRDAGAHHRVEVRVGRSVTRGDRLAAASDRYLSEQDRLSAALDRDFAESDRRESARERDAIAGLVTVGWGEAGDRRDLASVLRDDAARRRDEVALHRARAAETRDVDADRRERYGPADPALAYLRDRAGAERDRVATARDVAATLRDVLALERERRSADRAAAGLLPPTNPFTTDRQDVESVAVAPPLGLDPETGVLLPSEGLWVLGRELARADAGGEPVSGVVLDVEALLTPSQNLTTVVDRLRRMLSHRELVVRWTTTSFLVVVVGHDGAATAALEDLLTEPPALVRRTHGQSLASFLEAVTGHAPN